MMDQNHGFPLGAKLIYCPRNQAFFTVHYLFGQWSPHCSISFVAFGANEREQVGGSVDATNIRCSQQVDSDVDTQIRNRREKDRLVIVSCV